MFVEERDGWKTTGKMKWWINHREEGKMRGNLWGKVMGEMGEGTLEGKVGKGEI